MYHQTQFCDTQLSLRAIDHPKGALRDVEGRVSSSSSQDLLLEPIRSKLKDRIMTGWKEERKKSLRAQEPSPARMPEGRYSKDKPNLNRRVFRGGAPARSVGSKKEANAKTDSVSRRFVSYILFCLCLAGLS